MLKSIAISCVAVILTAAAIFFADGLHAIWWLMWLAPIPVLLLAPRSNAMVAFAAAFVAWAGGHLNAWNYYNQLHIPLPVIGLILTAPAIVFGLTVLLYRALLLRGQALAAAVALPCVWVLFQYFSERANGSYGNLAYTQMDCLPLLQLAAFTGMAGIAFVVLLIPATVAATLSVRRRRPLLLLSAGVILASAFGLGVWRLSTGTGDYPTVVVGMVVSDLKADRLPEEPEDVRRLLRAYAAESKKLAARGARIILLPEMTAVVIEPLIPELDTLFGNTAHATNAQILVPIIHPTPEGPRNEARLYDASGRLAAQYWKHHLVPVFEDRTKPGTEITVLRQPGATLGIEICKDMDYVPLARRYGAEGVGLLLVPAWDFVVDDWQHGRMAIMRGVENGFHIARVAKQGRMTISDTRGRVMAEQHSNFAPFATLIAPAGRQGEATLYTRWGDWFVWLAVLGLLAILLLCFRSRAAE